MKTPEIFVTDHALVRYIERHYGLSLEPMREEIRQSIKGPATVGATTHSLEKITFCFSKALEDCNRIVVRTVLERQMKRIRKQAA